MYWTEHVVGVVCDRRECVGDAGQRARQTFRGRTREFAMRSARESGWTVSAGGDVCPACKRAEARRLAERELP